MSFLQGLYTLVAHLPDLIKLLNIITAQVKEAQTDRKVATDLKVIADAFTNKDAQKLNDLFHSK